MNQKELKRRLHYDPVTGIFTRIRSPRQGRWGGRVAGTINSAGYVYISIDRRRYLAHRLAFLYMTGRIPEVVDHRDGPSNAWHNLRPATREGNGTNARGWRTTKSGAKGVWRQPGRKNYAAAITINGKSRWLGSFPTIELAKEAYTKAQRKKAMDLFGSPDALKPEAY